MSTPSSEKPFAGQQVVLVGRLDVLSRRDVRSIVERGGGTMAQQATPRTTIVIAAGSFEAPPGVTGRVIDEAAFCRQAGLPDPATLRQQYYAARDLRSMYPALGDEHLRYLERWGVVRPIVGRYSFADGHVLRQAAAGIAQGRPLPALRRSLSAEAQGQLQFEFQPRSERPPARVVSLEPRGTVVPHRTAERERLIATASQALATKYFLEGAELDDGPERNLEGAAAAYRRAALFDPALVPAIVNLANIYYVRDQLVEAEALYEKAARIDPDCFEAYFNLGNIHHDLGRFGEAVEAYSEALSINPSYPEAHFYLAVTLEKLGRSAEARIHWREYQQLAPDGEFADLAKEFSE